jgi:hypothetical protein
MTMKLAVLVTALIASIALAAPAEAAAKKSKKDVARTAPAGKVVASRPGADPYAVYVGGEYIGRDPDPNIRAMMMRNPHIWDGPE